MSSEKKLFKEWIKENENKWIIVGIITICFAMLMPIAIFFISKSSLSSESFAKLGTVGDFLGGSTVGILSLASMFFLISTIVMQRKELGLQREELQMTRDELAKANEQYKLTNDTMLKQQFETTFFNMINMHNNLVDGLTLFGEDVNGRETIVKYYNEINSYFYIEKFEHFIDNLLFDFDDEDNLVVLHKLICDFHKRGHRYEYTDFEKFSDRLKMIDHSGGWRIENSYIKLLGLEPSFHLRRRVERSYRSNQFANMLRDAFFNNEEIQKSAFSYIDSQKHYPLSNYKKSIKTIIRFVDESKFTMGIKEKYLDIFFSQFTIHELTVLKYFAELDDGRELKEYFLKYNNLNTKDSLRDSILSHSFI